MSADTSSTSTDIPTRGTDAGDRVDGRTPEQLREVRVEGAEPIPTLLEALEALPGVGRLLLEAVLVRDLLMVQGVALVIAVSYVVVNFTVDILYSYLDPRISHGRSAARV